MRPLPGQQERLPRLRHGTGQRLAHRHRDHRGGLQAHSQGQNGHNRREMGARRCRGHPETARRHRHRRLRRLLALPPPPRARTHPPRQIPRKPRPRSVTSSPHKSRTHLECGGYGVFILGHRHPAVTAAVVRQVMTHPLATRVLLEPVAARAAQAVAEITPPGLEYIHFVSTGTEATEAAIKMARGNGRRRLVSTINGYHGKTMGALSVTGRQIYQDPFAPLLPDRAHVPFGDTDALVRVLESAPGECCVFLEPVQGEGGVVIPPAGYLRDVRGACDEYGAMLVLDEILTGLGRCGRMWGADIEGV